jgi:hypothetical protein
MRRGVGLNPLRLKLAITQQRENDPNCYIVKGTQLSPTERGETKSIHSTMTRSRTIADHQSVILKHPDMPC